MEPVLRAEHICYFYGNKQALKDVSFTIPNGQFISLIGPNGSGKSTLFHLLCGNRKSQSGIVYYGEKAITSISVEERARLFSVIFQEEESKFPFTGMDMVLFGMHPFRTRLARIKKDQMKRVETIMQRTDTLQFKDKPVTQISGGEYQRIVLARAIVQNPRVLFLDEAMSELDIAAKIAMLQYLKELIDSTGLTVLSIEHDLMTAYRYSDCVLALYQGNLAAFGEPNKIMNEAFFADIFHVEAEILPQKGFFIHDRIP